jgi:heme exporter protein C
MGEMVLYYIPLGATAALAAAAALAASIGYLRTRNLRFDSLARAATETLLAFLAASIVSGCFVTHAASGKWWTWDARLTAALVCWLLFATCPMLRQAVEEPSRRAAFAAVWSVFACLDVPLVVATAAWWKPGKALAIEWTWPRFWLLAAMAVVAGPLTVARARRAETRREPDSLRRTPHAM